MNTIPELTEPGETLTRDITTTVELDAFQPRTEVIEAQGVWYAAPGLTGKTPLGTHIILIPASEETGRALIRQGRTNRTCTI